MSMYTAHSEITKLKKKKQKKQTKIHIHRTCSLEANTQESISSVFVAVPYTIGNNQSASEITAEKEGLWTA